MYEAPLLYGNLKQLLAANQRKSTLIESTAFGNVRMEINCMVWRELRRKCLLAALDDAVRDFLIVAIPLLLVNINYS